MTTATPAIIRLGRVTSTQAVAWALAGEGAPDGTVVVADTQTAGRGRHGRTWLDEPGASLLASYLMRPRLDPARLPTLSLAAAVAVAETLEGVTGLHPRLKWPNDVLVRGRKIAGILLESRLDGSSGRAEPLAPLVAGAACPPRDVGGLFQKRGAPTPPADALASGAARSSNSPPSVRGDPTPLAPIVIIGVGINLAQSSFADGLAARATSVRLEGAATPDREAMLRALSEALERWRRRLESEGFGPVRSRWRSLAESLGRPVTVDGVSGVAVDVDDTGALVVEADGRRHTVVSGELEESGMESAPRGPAGESRGGRSPRRP